MGRAQSPTHAGGVVYRLRDSGPEFLLVTARRAPGEWVYPKGHIERGEDPEGTAVREVEEETGIRAEIVRHLADTSIDSIPRPARVRWFLMRAISENPSNEGRRTLWLTGDAAAERLTFDNTRTLLRKALKILEP